MKKIIDLIAGPGSNKDAKLLDYIRKNYLVNNSITNLCFISGQGDTYETHTQIGIEDFRKLVFEKNDKDTIYFLRSFFVDKDRDNYLKLLEEMCENDIQIFKTDQVEEHMGDKNWNDKYCEFIYLEDL